MGFIEQFFKDKKEISPEDVESFISQKIEENMNLDYKDIRMYKDPDKLATHIASFANSEGGLIILGVGEEKIKDENGNVSKIYPEGITWGEVSLAKEALENKISVRIKPPIDGLFIKPIRKKEKVIFLIDIPKSNSSPHMSPDYKYNKRVNFGIQAMDHYEVANLFRVNWVMKEKLVEKIYEPLASILEKHAGELSECRSPSRYEMDEILSRTYYKMQMPFELLERVDYYMDEIDELDKKVSKARIAVNEIVTKRILEYIRKPEEFDGNIQALTSLPFELQIFNESKKISSNLDQYYVYSLILRNRKVRTHVDSMHLGTEKDVLIVIIKRSGEPYSVGLKEFDEIVWSKCLKDASENADIAQVRKDADTMCEEAYELIDEIIGH